MNQPTLFDDTARWWESLPTGPFKHIPTYRCPGCGRHPESGGGGPVYDEAGVRVGTECHNGCCGFQWFRAGE